MTFDEHKKNVMRYIDGEMDSEEREAFRNHLASCEDCRSLLSEFGLLKEVTNKVKIADLPETVWEHYWTSVYNRLERSVAWFLFILGTLIISAYSLYQFIIDPSIGKIVRFGIIIMGVGFAILFLSVLREKLTINRHDRYISEVKR